MKRRKARDRSEEGWGEDLLASMIFTLVLWALHGMR